MIRFSRFFVRRICSIVPKQPTWKIINEQELPLKTRISSLTIQYLERLSLVQLGDEDGTRRLEESINLADKLSVVNVESIYPLENVLESENVFLREDYVTEGDKKEDLLQMTAMSEDDYYIAPPGNIPVKLGLKLENV